MKGCYKNSPILSDPWSHTKFSFFHRKHNTMLEESSSLSHISWGFFSIKCDFSVISLFRLVSTFVMLSRTLTENKNKVVLIKTIEPLLVSKPLGQCQSFYRRLHNWIFVWVQSLKMWTLFAYLASLPGVLRSHCIKVCTKFIKNTL